MFVRESKYRKVLAELLEVRAEAEGLKAQRAYHLSIWNKLVDRINTKGGEAFLARGVMPGKSSHQLSQDDIRRLLQLCHPDKHGGKDLASQMTAKLLAMKD